MDLKRVCKCTRETECDHCADAHSNGFDCEQTGCQECCPHEELDHFVCCDCGYETDPGEAIDAAMDAFEDR